MDRSMRLPGDDDIHDRAPLPPREDAALRADGRADDVDDLDARDPADDTAFRGVPDEAEGMQHAPGGPSDDADSAILGDARRDPSPENVAGRHDAGARGRDREHGGWGDRGLFGGRAGGTGP